MTGFIFGDIFADRLPPLYAVYKDALIVFATDKMLVLNGYQETQ